MISPYLTCIKTYWGLTFNKSLGIHLCGKAQKPQSEIIEGKKSMRVDSYGCDYFSSTCIRKKNPTASLSGEQGHKSTFLINMQKHLEISTWEMLHFLAYTATQQGPTLVTSRVTQSNGN